MPNRVIKDSIKRSPQIDSLTWFEEVVFCRLIVTVDDYGCTDGRPVVLKNDLFPTKESVTKKAVEAALAKLDRVGLIKRYDVDGVPYLYLTTWNRHQRIRNKQRRYPKPPEDFELTADCGQLTADCCQTSADCLPESNPNPIQSEYESEREILAQENNTPKRFQKPTQDQVAEYCRERKNNVDPERFCDYYDSNGWKVGGKSPMKDWKAAVRNWEKRDSAETGSSEIKSKLERLE